MTHYVRDNLDTIHDVADGLLSPDEIAWLEDAENDPGEIEADLELGEQ